MVYVIHMYVHVQCILLFDKVDCFVLDSRRKLVCWLQLTSSSEGYEENPAITLFQELIEHHCKLILAQHFSPLVCLHLSN